VGRLPGVGKKSEQRLHALGLRTVGQLAALPERTAIDLLGEAGRHLWRLAHGLDDSPVVADREAKSLSVETTFARDVDDRAVLRGWLLELVDQLGRRLRQRGVRGRVVEVKARSSDFRTLTRSLTLDAPTDLTEVLWRSAAELWERRIPADLLPLRLLGVGAAGLVGDVPVQGQLFDDGWRARQAALDEAVDAIRRRFGDGVIRRGAADDSFRRGS
jgi:nucleotidyltransferase/DNA polymerase involved in DNA repair